MLDPLDLMPRIDPATAKIWFAHVHKASGTSFSKQLCDITPAPCEPVSCCQTRDTDLRRVQDWWFFPNASCTFQTNEDHVASIVARVRRNRTKHSDEPRLVSLYRDPLGICRSDWAYVHRLCSSFAGRLVRELSAYDARRLQSLAHARGRQLDTRSFCAWAMPRYPDTPLGQLAFAREKANGMLSLSRGFAHELKLYSAPEAFRWIQNNVNFWGVSELYTVSVCLLWFQTGLLDKFKSTCSCQPPNRTVTAFHMLNTAPKDAAKEAASPFNISHAELERLFATDLALYRLLRTEFERRVRLVEAHTGVMFWCPT